MWKETIKQARNLKIFRDELDEFLPEKILDFHTHVFPQGMRRQGHDCVVNAAGNKLSRYTVGELDKDLGALFPGRNCHAVCFGMPFMKLDTQKNNDYVSACCDRKRFFPFRLVRPEDKPDTVEKEVIKKRFYGFKPYPEYVNKAKNDVEIKDMLPASLMEIADRHRLIITLHLPRKNRLSDPLNRKQIIETAEKYPDAKIILAHTGRAYFLKNITGNLKEIKKLPNVYFDLAMLNNWEVLEYLFAEVDSSKILFGTDLPMAVAPGKSVEINDQYTYVTPMRWNLSIRAENKKIVFTSFAYEEIRSIKKAAQRLALPGIFAEDIFFNNGKKLLESIRNLQ